MNTATYDTPAVPLTILTGFLGSGKTTLLNRILNGNHGLKVAVLVNDFGAINIDADLVVGVESDVISLANGCVCCTIRDDLVETVMQTIDRPEGPEYIILEASGVAQPASIAMTFNNGSLRDRIRLDSIICVVDAEHVFAAPEMMELKMFQIACSDMAILNKVDLVDRGHVAKIRQWLDKRFHRYRLVEASHGDVPLEILLSVGRFDPEQIQAMSPQHCDDPGCTIGHVHRDHGAAFSTWSYETDRPLSLKALRQAAAKLPADIYRAKGVIYASDDLQHRTVLQIVGRRVDVSLAGDWDGRPRRTQIVAIGAPGAIVPAELQETFDRCATGPP
ncbi:MAG: GTP-binding protein [Thermomicrobiales bacterium]|nr:MAG: GTP-binding protein [Thermomicrobiales bacterium]